MPHLLGLRHLVRNVVLPDSHDPAPAYDAVFTVWFNTAEVMRAAFASLPGPAEIADG